MTLADFLQHWSITENPFRDEEARSDGVFARMVLPGASRASDAEGNPAAGPVLATKPAFHSDFEKVLGDPTRPSSAIVFGEKGSGKTAMRMQIAERIRRHNSANPQGKVLFVSYDDLNAVLDRLHARLDGKSPLESFQKIRLVDHIDAVMHAIVPRLVDAMLSETARPELIDLGGDPRRSIRSRLRRLPDAIKSDVLVMQAVYDRPDDAAVRTSALRRQLGVMLPWSRIFTWIAATMGWLPAAALFAAGAKIESVPDSIRYLFFALIGLWIIAILKLAVWDRLSNLRQTRKLRKQLRIFQRADRSFAASLAQLHSSTRTATVLPLNDSDEPRYAMLTRMRRVLASFGYAGIIVVVDRVDEPTLVSGDPDRMRAVVWPMLNNKFLQQDGIGFKLLLPIELRHLLFKESSAFFQQARMDKQSLIEQLAWTGPMLYDLCDARLQACRDSGGPGTLAPITLLDLFAEDVTRQDLLDALDQMRQPRDAFKFVYRCLTEHAASVTRDQHTWRIPRHLLEQVRRQEVDRVMQFHRGIRPA